jgi:hypothetical protein
MLSPPQNRPQALIEALEQLLDLRVFGIVLREQSLGRLPSAAQRIVPFSQTATSW